jgi:hypothetical protein
MIKPTSEQEIKYSTIDNEKAEIGETLDTKETAPDKFISNTLRDAQYSVRLGNEGKVFLKVVGEDSAESEITQFVAPLLSASSLARCSESKKREQDVIVESEGENNNEESAPRLVDFATISCTDDVEFTCEGKPITQKEGLQILSDRIIDALRKSVENS